MTICVLTFAFAASAQNTIKLFDPVAIGASDSNVLMNTIPYGLFKSAQVYLSCPTSARPVSTISGPNGGNFIVDNVLMIGETNICRGNCFSSLIAEPGASVGMPVEFAYGGVAPINVSREITASGLYTFNLLDFGYTYGSSAIYLTTSCSIIPVNTPTEPEPVPVPIPPVTPSGDSVICHRNNGNQGSQTLTVGPSAVAAHLAHGDTAGACR